MCCTGASRSAQGLQTGISVSFRGGDRQLLLVACTDPPGRQGSASQHSDGTLPFQMGASVLALCTEYRVCWQLCARVLVG